MVPWASPFCPKSFKCLSPTLQTRLTSTSLKKVSESVRQIEQAFQPSSAEVESLVSEYLASVGEYKSVETVGTYQRSLNQFVKWLSITKMKSPFTEKGIEAYKRYLIERKGLKEASISTYLTAVRRFCGHLVDSNLISENPASNISGSKRPQDHSRGVLSSDQVDKLLSSIDADDVLGLRDSAIIHCMLFAGLSEIELVRADLGDLEQTLMGNFLRVQGKGRTAKDQQVQLDDKVYDTITSYLKERDEAKNDQPLFVSHGFRSNGKRLTTRAIRNRISLQFELSELKSMMGSAEKLTPHSLTHTAAVLWLKSGMSLEEVKKKMRHGSLETTQIYAQVD